MTQTNQAVPRFSDLGIAPDILAVLDQLYAEPTPIQHQVIPAALAGKDIVGIAQTGTGKTLAFGVPMLQKIMNSDGQGLVILPTRELALQVDEVLQKIGRSLRIKTAVLIGGASSYNQVQQLRRNPHVVVATPGRLADHLQQKNYSLKNVSVIVLDEADRMLDIGFLPEIKRILGQAPADRQTMLFSATMPSKIAQIAATYMKSPQRFEVAPAGTPAAHIEQGVLYVSPHEKMQLLEKLLTDIDGTILVFSRTKHGAKKITAGVCNMGHNAVEIHSNRSLAQRRDALSGFKSGKYRVLVATDIASRGIDVNDITLVINFDLPENPEDYVHRIGRTGRAGKAGRALTFAAHSERMDVRQIERLIRKPLPTLAVPVLPARRAPVHVEPDEQRGFSGRRSFGARPPSGARPSSNHRPSAARPASGRPSFAGRSSRPAGRQPRRVQAGSFSGRSFRGRGSR